MPANSPKLSNDYRAMRELLEAESDKQNPFQAEQSQQQKHQPPSNEPLTEQQRSVETAVEKAERQSPYQPQQATDLTSPMDVSTESNSGDGNYDDAQSEL